MYFTNSHSDVTATETESTQEVPVYKEKRQTYISCFIILCIASDHQHHHMYAFTEKC